MLDLLGRLPSVPTATHAEALDFLERRALMGRGIGFVDVHVLASAALAAKFACDDTRHSLAAVAIELDVAWE